MIKKMEKKVFLHAAVNGQNVCWSSGSSAPTPPQLIFLATKISLKFTFRKFNLGALKHPGPPTHFLDVGKINTWIGIFKTKSY